MSIYVLGVFLLLLILIAVCPPKAIPLGTTIHSVWKFRKTNYWVYKILCKCRSVLSISHWSYFWNFFISFDIFKFYFLPFSFYPSISTYIYLSIYLSINLSNYLYSLFLALLFSLYLSLSVTHFLSISLTILISVYFLSPWYLSVLHLPERSLWRNRIQFDRGTCKRAIRRSKPFRCWREWKYDRPVRKMWFFELSVPHSSL